MNKFHVLLVVFVFLSSTHTLPSYGEAVVPNAGNSSESILNKNPDNHGADTDELWKKFREGANFLRQNKFYQAFQIWHGMALQNFPHAQYSIAVLFEQGLGITRNVKESFRWAWAAQLYGHPLADKLKKKLMKNITKKEYNEIAEWQKTRLYPKVITLESTKLYADLLLEIEAYRNIPPEESYVWFLIAAAFGDKESAKIAKGLEDDIIPKNKLLTLQKNSMKKVKGIMNYDIPLNKKY